jgi:dihydroneopterin aldolase
MSGGDWLALEGMEFFGHHGDDAAERERGSLVYVDVEVNTDTATAGRSDSLADALDYVRCYERIRTVVEGRRFHLLEAIAENIADSLLEEPAARVVRVRVAKAPPLAGRIRRCVVNIERGRREASP